MKFTKTDKRINLDTGIARRLFAVIIFTVFCVLAFSIISVASSDDSLDIMCWDISSDSDSSVVAKLYADGEKYRLVISGEGTMRTFSSPEDVPWSEYYSSIAALIVECGVNNLTKYGFSECSELKDVRIYEKNLELPANKEVFPFIANIYGHRISTAEYFTRENYPNRFFPICNFKDAKCEECGYECKNHTGGAPTCNEGGKCLVCSTEYISPLNHRYSYVPEKRAFCYQTGTAEHYMCLDCRALFDSKKQLTNAQALEITVGHDYGELRMQSPPSCTEPGVYAHYECSMCQAFFDEQKNVVSEIIISEKGHIGGLATCLAGALCDECGIEYTQPDSTNHDFGDKLKYDENSHWLLCDCGAKDKIGAHALTGNVIKEATEYETGILDSKCSCGYKTQKMIPKLNTVFTDKDGTTDNANRFLVPLIISASVVLICSAAVTLFIILKKKYKNGIFP